MANDVSEDDDIPALESLSGSECIDEDAVIDDEPETAPSWHTDGAPLFTHQSTSTSMNNKIAVQWLCKDWAAIEEQMYIISLYTLSPFLYGCSHQSEKWLKWLCQAQLLNSDKCFSTGVLDHRARNAIDILEHAGHCVLNWMKEGWPPDSIHVTYMLDLLQEVRDCIELGEAIDKAKKNAWFTDVIHSFGGHSGPGGGAVVTSEGHVTAYLYLLTNTAECVCWYVERREQDSSTPLGRFMRDYDRQVDGLDVLQNEGMSSYSCEKYEDAIRKYNRCIEKYSFSADIYLQRSLCFLALRKPMEAVCDGLRAYHLDSKSDKIIDTYVTALKEAGELQKVEMLMSRFVSHSSPFVKPKEKAPTLSDGSCLIGLISHGTLLCFRTSTAAKEVLINKGIKGLAMELGADQKQDEICNGDQLLCTNNVRNGITSACDSSAVSEKTNPCSGLAVNNSVCSYSIQNDLDTLSDDGHSVGTFKSENSDVSTCTVQNRLMSCVEDKGKTDAKVEVSLCSQGLLKVEPCVVQQKTLTNLESNPVEPLVLAKAGIDVCLQVERTTAEKGVVTDPLPPVDTFKDKYEELLKEKKSLCARLEESEDRVVQLRKEHKRDLERVQKKVRQEVQDESSAKIVSLEAQLLDERSKEQHEKKEQAEQVKSLKQEIKAHKEKADKWKKDLNKKEHELETRLVQFQQDMDKGYTDKKRMEERLRMLEERLKAMSESNQKSMMRATSAEVELVTYKRDIALKSLENDVHRLELISQNAVVTSDQHQQLISFKEKFKAALSAYQTAIDDVIQQLKMGRELSSLPVPEPCLPVFSIPQATHPAMRSMLMPLMPHQNTMPQALPRVLPQGIPQPGQSHGGLQGPSQQGLSQGLQGLTQGAQQGLPPSTQQGISQGVQQGLSQGVHVQQGISQGVQQSLSQGAHVQQGLSQGAPQGPSHQAVPQTLPPQSLSQSVLQGLYQGVPQSLSQNVQQGRFQGVPQGLPQSAQQGPFQGVPQSLSQSVMQGLSQGVPQGLFQQGLPQGLGMVGGQSHGLFQQGPQLQGVFQQGQQGLFQQALSQPGQSYNLSQQGLPQGLSQVPGLPQGVSQNMPQDLSQGMPIGTNTAYPLISSVIPLLANMHVPSLVMPGTHPLPSATMLQTQSVFQDPMDAAAFASLEQELLNTPKKRNGLDRIVQNLAPFYPQLSRDDCKTILNAIRKQNGNTLSGCSLDTLSQQVKAVLDGGGLSAVNSTNTSVHLSIPVQQQPIKRPFTPSPGSFNEYDDEGCIICYEEMSSYDTSKLNCGHRFHTECIRLWLKEQRTCPTCRNHALLTDDYPYLDQTVQKAH